MPAMVGDTWCALLGAGYGLRGAGYAVRGAGCEVNVCSDWLNPRGMTPLVILERILRFNKK